MKKVLRILMVLMLMMNVGKAVAQKKERNCESTCFRTEVISAEQNSEGCTDYELNVFFEGRCAHALSHYTVAVPCGEVKNLSNSENWKQVFGLDPTTGLYGFKIDDIPNFGETSTKSFSIKFTLCSTNASCADQVKCWQPVVAYKASTCVNYDTLAVSCKSLKASIQKTDVSCYGVANGSLTVVVEEGQEPYTFTWSNGATGASLTGLAAGNYSVVVKDATGAEVTLSAEIQQPAAIEITGTVSNASCGGTADGSIDITVAGGRGGYSYTWSNGSTTQDLPAIKSGTYIVTVKDSTGCSAQKIFSVTNTVQMVIFVTPTLPGCNQTNGGLNITVSGGMAPYTYTWSNGATTEDLQSVGAGQYKVVVTDSKGCSAELTYNLRENNTLRITAILTPTGCLDDATGAVDATVTGGTPPYTYSWSNGSTSEDLSGLLSGLYTLTVTDANGCTATLRAAVSKKSIQANATVTQPLCHGDSTGSITVNPYGGTEPYQYTWSNGSTGNSISDLPAGVYDVNITDSTGCSRKLIFVITDPTAITAAATVSNDQCNADGHFNIDLTVSGGKEPYQYEWSNGSTTQDLDSVGTGTYTVVITDANGCTLTKEVIVSGGASGLTCLITQPDSIPSCGSTNNVLSTSVSGADSYTWSVASSDGLWKITTGASSGSITYTAGQKDSNATFTLVITKDGCTQTCSLTLASCASDSTGGGDPDPGNGGGGEGPGNETCDECFDTSVVEVSDNGSCKTYEITVNTDGNCRHDLSHWDIAIPCGTLNDYANSEGWKMEFGKDPTTGLYGLKVDDINGFGGEERSFTVKFMLCYNDACGDMLDDWNPVVAYKAGQCIGYDTVNVENDDNGESPELTLKTYPNPFSSEVTFEWTAEEDDYVTLDIMDQFGKKVAELFSQKVSKGEKYKFDWVRSDLKESLYIYRLHSSKQTVYGKLFKTR